MTFRTLAGLLLLFSATVANAQTQSRHLYLCRSPLLASDFGASLQSLVQQGVKVTPAIAEQICAGMRAGADPQCIRATAPNFTPFSSGWNGAMAMTDGSTKIWFHNPDAFGWIESNYYISYLNHGH